ncbi:leucyl aminopeptidase [Wolbachia endosymbiont of Dirofilaria (Dirofilaria) immitis]|uniref:leucyl aminopeptidase n=1 Tax=Wolbachia endosymbiont of Dirofilaria (Dirofilaria) immitis TaxID=1812115 RepID=UPI00158891A3|nr:leucyl aminopeptidase [Wolbachia endosymbiont of Dirofilaria (Dirofilaria) immitis]QKX02436.1 leucyl aminopeptidase [Wolbachia endosymbiont of Dirofilaria (Dirofilaria) immitis]
MKIMISRILPNFKTIVVGLFEDNEAISNCKILQEKRIVDNIKQFSNFNGGFGEFFSITSSEGKNIMVIGLGKRGEWDGNKELNIGGKVYCELSKLKIKQAVISIEGNAANIAYGALLRSFKFDKYKTKKDEKITEVEEIIVLVKDEQLSSAERSFERLRQEGEGIFLARSLITEPPNVLYPESYADRIKAELTKFDLEIEVLDKKQMEEKKMKALLGVAQGSSKEPKLVVIKWNGVSEQKPIAFVGKGITFDTGGISLKPSRGMESMKYDMAGSAAVVGIMRTLAGRKAKVNAIGIVALAENAVGSNAQRPSDVVTSMSGQTIEVLNTDAEGRLILADALWYTQDRFSPKFMIDLATLTGAIVVALGNNEYAGLFSNNDELANYLINAGNEVNEKLWRFPINETYNKIIDSPIADMQNIAPAGSGGDSIMAAQFLQRFVNNTCWAHLDIAGTAWHEKGTDISPKGAVGFGVRLLNKLVEKYYEASN